MNIIGLLLFCAMIMPSAIFANEAGTSSLRIAENGISPYQIVIGRNSTEAEQLAARELAHFFREATKINLEIVTDVHPPENFEIILGETNRLNSSVLPDGLRPQTSDGYTCFVDSGRIHILGRNPRGTLYGVYDWLEENLGIRFLAPDVTHVPAKPVLDVSSRSFRHDPPMEYRNICTFQDTTWGIRNRLNARWGYTLEEKMLGGVQWIGPTIHTMAKYIPPNEYFEKHPEYFALVNGKRRSKSSSGSQPAQLCLSNPDVYKIVLKKMKAAIEAYSKSSKFNSTSKLLLEFSRNDGGENCECPECAAVNREEKTEGGTLFRILNRLADALAKDYPQVCLESMAYGYTRTPPTKTVLRDNIIIRFAPLSADQGRLITDISSERNREVLEDLQNWQGKSKQFYLWNYYYNSYSWLDIFPDIPVLVENLRLYRQHGARGLFAESSYTPASEMRELRHYLLAQTMWKQDIDEEAVIREFCQLYYGDGAENFLRYLRFCRDYFLSLAPKPLLCQGTLPFSDTFLQEADAILEQAEQAASTEETKFRIAVARLPVWYQILQKQFADSGKISELPDEWNFRPDPDDRGLTEQWQKISDFKEWSKISIGSWVAQGHPLGVAWYANTLKIGDDIPNGTPLALYFGSVDGTCDIYLNGEKIGEQKEPPHIMWNSSFYINLPKSIPPGNHQLVLRVEKNRSAAGITRPVSLVDRSRNVSGRVRTIGERFMEVAKKAGLRGTNTIFRNSNQIEDDLFPKIRTLLQAKSSGEELAPWILRKTAALLPNVHSTWEIAEDADSLSGSSAVQKNNQKRNAAQGVNWSFDRDLTDKGAPIGSQYKLRVRVKLNANAPQGVAFSFGYILYKNADWRGSVEERHIHRRELKPNEWQWVDYPEIITFREGINGNRVFVTATENPSIESIAIDVFELIPLGKEGLR